jgi:hypothetical protein
VATAPVVGGDHHQRVVVQHAPAQREDGVTDQRRAGPRATRYGTPTIVRRFNQLPPQNQNGGFGVPEVTTHLPNFHSAPDSDGGPCDPVQQRFFFRGQYYDYFYNL